MCFSVEADLALGVAVGVVGVDALRHVSRPAQVPLAALPLVFAAHQLNEAFVWWGLEGTLSATAARVAAWLYLLVAFSFPVLVPLAVALVEPDRARRRVMRAFGAVGAVVSAVLVAALVSGGPNASIQDLHISYSVDVRYGSQLAAVYVLATCGGLLASSDRRIVLFGVCNLVAVTVLGWFLMSGVISLWCAWAAVLSVLIAGYLRGPAPTAGTLRRATV